MEPQAQIGIIGGTGIYDPKLFQDAISMEIQTPFGSPSAPIQIGKMGAKYVAFISRHGLYHQYSPSELNYRANIYALKLLGVKYIISIAAVGSLKHEIKPLDIVIPDQIYDRTLRSQSFFGSGLVAHIDFSEPFCPKLSKILYDAASKLGCEVHRGGTYVCIEGPQFSTIAESREYRSRGFDIVGMTACPEAKLAREAEICYGMIATVTDYDVWAEKRVSAEMVIQNISRAEKMVKHILVEAIPRIDYDDCSCWHSLKTALVTDISKLDPEIKQKLKPLIQKYIT